MKIRNGFVSNSSSSSFVCVISKQDHDTILSNLSNDQKKLVDQTCIKGKIGSLEVVGFGNMSDMGGETLFSGGIATYDIGEEDFDMDDFDTAMYEYEKFMDELGIQSFSMTFDM